MFHVTTQQKVNEWYNPEVKPASPVEFRLNRRTHVVIVDGRPSARLTPREFSLLDYLYKRRPRLIAAEELYKKLWRKKIPGFYGAHDRSAWRRANLKTVQVHLKKIRNKLNLERTRILLTKWGKGYAIDLKGGFSDNNGRKKREVLAFLNRKVFSKVLKSRRANARELKPGVAKTLRRMRALNVAGIVQFYWDAIKGTERSRRFHAKMKKAGFTTFEDVLVEFRSDFTTEWLRK